MPQVEPPTVVSAEGQGAPAPTISDKGEQGKAIQAAPGEAEVKKSDEKEPEPVEAPLTASKKPAPPAVTPVQAQRKPGPVEAPLTASKKPAPRAKTPAQAPKRAQVQKKKKKEGRGSPLNFKTGSATCSPSPRGGEKAPSPPSCQGAREVTSSSQARRQPSRPSTGSGGRERKVNVRVRF